jgi:hypothetical protein
LVAFERVDVVDRDAVELREPLGGQDAGALDPLVVGGGGEHDVECERERPGVLAPDQARAL